MKAIIARQPGGPEVLELVDIDQPVAQEGVDNTLEVVGAVTLRDTLKSIRQWGQVVVIGLLGGAPVLESFSQGDIFVTTKPWNRFQFWMLSKPVEFSISLIFFEKKERDLRIDQSGRPTYQRVFIVGKSSRFFKKIKSVINPTYAFNKGDLICVGCT